MERMKPGLLRVTPFLIISACLFIVVVYEVAVERGGPDGWRYHWLGKLVTFLFLASIVDIILKLIVQKKLIVIWIIEVFLCIVATYIWVIS